MIVQHATPKISAGTASNLPSNMIVLGRQREGSGNQIRCTMCGGDGTKGIVFGSAEDADRYLKSRPDKSDRENSSGFTAWTVTLDELKGYAASQNLAGFTVWSAEITDTPAAKPKEVKPKVSFIDRFSKKTPALVGNSEPEPPSDPEAAIATRNVQDSFILVPIEVLG